MSWLGFVDFMYKDMDAGGGISLFVSLYIFSFASYVYKAIGNIVHFTIFVLHTISTTSSLYFIRLKVL